MMLLSIAGRRAVFLGAAYCCLYLAAGSGAAAQLPDPGKSSPPTVTVSGDGTAFLQPDRVRITVVLKETGGQLAQFGEALAKKEKRVLDAVKSTAPEIRILSRGDRIHGPAAGAQVTANSVAAADRAISFELSKTDSAGAVADAAIKNGAEIDQIEYLASESSAPYEKAIEDATRAAKSKAAAAARGLGLKLGRAVEVAVAEEPAGEAIQRDREMGRDPNRFSSKEVRVFVTARYEVTE